jgi:hypothetical protein
VISENTDQNKSVADDLRSTVYEEAIPRSKKIVFNRFNRVHFVKVAIYCSVLEQSVAVITLVDAKLGYHSYPLLRGQFEGLADIINLNKSDKYIRHLEYQYLESFHRQLIAAKNGSPYFRTVSQDPNFMNRLSECGKQLKALRSDEISRLDPKEKLNRAGLKEEYDALYGMLNDHSHGGIKSLLARHLHIIDGDDHSLVAFNHVSQEQFVAPLQTSLDIVLRASVAIHRAFATGEEEFFQKEIQRLSY